MKNRACPSIVTTLLLRGFLFGASVASCGAQNAPTGTVTADTDPNSLEQQMADMRATIARLQARVEELEKRQGLAAPQPAETPNPQPSPSLTASGPAPTSSVSSSLTQTSSPAEQNTGNTVQKALANVLGTGTTLSLNLDAYYEYNFNQPIGRVNELRAYDVLSNAFSINQADLIIENAPDVANGKRWGARVDLQFGQATETSQGNPSNEPRPEIYRDIFQAYGTYVAPIGNGLTIDVGKFASSLGYEGNYTKDQIDYSRSFWFNFLPFYHLGLRANYKFNNIVQVNYWMVNGTNQSEPFNGFKDEFIGFVVTPSKKLTWTAQYYLGQEHPDVMFFPNGGAPANAPTLQGTPFEPITNSPTGKLHIIDTYVNWQATPKLLFAIEVDDIISRLYLRSYPQRADGGAFYLKYQFTPKFYLGTRYEHFSDSGGLFSGSQQLLQENTITAAYQLADGLQIFGEWRRDFSNRPYFYSSVLDVLKAQQNTAGLGFVWWFGGKEGSW